MICIEYKIVLLTFMPVGQENPWHKLLLAVVVDLVSASIGRYFISNKSQPYIM